MMNIPRFSVTKLDVDRCMADVDSYDNVMECPCCCYFLDRRNAQVIEQIVESLEPVPESITLLRVPILPTPDNKFYYSFNGIETIIYNLFKTSNKKLIADLKKGETYLKVYYKRDPLFLLPMIMIEIIFFNPLHDKSIDELWKKLKSELLFFTGSVGDIESIPVEEINDIRKVLHVPLLIGQPKFKKEGALLLHRFTNEQLQEMNYNHSIAVSSLSMSEVINNNELSLFEEQKLDIISEIIKEKNEIDRIVNSMFPDKEYEPIEDKAEIDSHDLPF